MSILSDIARRLHLVPGYDPKLTVRNVAYFSGSDAHVNHKLDIFLPSPSDKLLTSTTDAEGGEGEEEESQKKVPIIFHVHGGGWVRGSRTNEWRGGPEVGRTSAKEGFIGVVASYRLARVSPASFFTWASIFGLIILIPSIALFSWELITGYVICMTALYAYRFLYNVRKPVHVEHVR